MSPRAYLLDRFRSDAGVLRERAESLRSGPPQPGPDAVTSARMADACDEVVAMIEALPENDESSATIAALTALTPLLERRAAANSEEPPVRSVFAGAATRIREIAEAEARHQQTLASKDHEPYRDEPIDDDEDDNA